MSKPRHIAIGEGLTKQIQEMADYFQISWPEALRRAVSEYYIREYRRLRFGYQAGTEAVGRVNKSGKKSQLEGILAELVALNTASEDADTQINAFLEEQGYLEDYKTETGTGGYVYRKDTGALFFGISEGNYKSDIYTFNELLGDFKKFLTRKLK